ncbi:MAG TPA: MFS transporter [Pseudonocardiaceae bacterium]|jgi:MFS family permease
MGVLIATVDGSIVIISLPAIFRGIGLDPLAPGNIGYLLWMILGYLLVTAVLVVALGRLGDMFGRVRMYNLGFVIFSGASLALSLDPFSGGLGALWLIGWRVIQAFGGAMLTANSAAILTDAFPARQRGMALGINQITALAGQFLGLLAGGLLAAIDWRAVFWVSVPIGIVGTVWSYRTLREVGTKSRGRVDWIGNLTFTVGTALLLAAITYGIQPYNGNATGWTNPTVLGGLGLGIVLLIAFCVAETKVAEPMFRLSLFKIRAFAAGNLAALLTAIARGGLQFMLIIWLQGIWLPLHGFDYEQTPLWAGIYMLPLTFGFLIAGPLSGYLSDRFGARMFATGGLAIVAVSFLGLMILPVNFDYLDFAGLLLLSGLGQGMFSAPNTSAIMSSVPANQRGVASGMRSTFQNSGTALSIGVFFSLMISGLATTLPHTLNSGLQAQGVPANVAGGVASLPPVSTLFATFLGNNPISHLLAPSGVLNTLPAHNVQALTGNEFFPQLVSGPFHHGLVIVFSAAAIMAVVAATASVLRGKREVPTV